MQQVVLPIKDSNVLKEVQDKLLNNFKGFWCKFSLLT
ncbi:hypothetical protein FAM18168_00124 [Lacticaseibacillus paracasei]|nr:hypothetical protein FAM18149_00172 [Lacticaseibacillus paracasei]RND86823.1 hypothetical protein FAM18168_00124 [Lacticaseibacillus paracasei]